MRKKTLFCCFLFCFPFSLHCPLAGILVHTELQNKQYLGYCLSALWVNRYLLSSVGVVLIPDAAQKPHTFLPDQAAVMSSCIVSQSSLKHDLNSCVLHLMLKKRIIKKHYYYVHFLLIEVHMA